MNVHLNGQIVPASDAKISAFDRGFIFGDGVYEGLRAFRYRVVEAERHTRRFRQGLEECRIAWDPAPMARMTEELLRANGMPDAFIYWQVTRGVPLPGQPLRQRIPGAGLQATVFGFCTPQPAIEQCGEPKSVIATVREDTRWTRGHVKSTSLLGNVLAAIEASEQGTMDAVLVREGFVGEGTCANLALALPTRGGGVEIVTPTLESAPILGGITRAQLIDRVPELVQRAVRVEELFRASEIMLLGTTAMVTSITRLDGRAVGSGEVGPVARYLQGALVAGIRRELGLDEPEHGGAGVVTSAAGAPVVRTLRGECGRSTACA